jgi:predicted transcriptional regulator
MPLGLGSRQAELIRTLADFERSAKEKDGGLSTIELARKVFGRKYTPADRVQVARSLNRLLTLGMIYKTKKPTVARGGNRTVYWRIHPRIIVQ